METKLTLRMDSAIIERAREYAANNKTSISKMVAVYLDLVTSSEYVDGEITPLVKNLSGIIDLKADYDYRREFSDHYKKKKH